MSLANQIRKKLLIFTDIEMNKIEKLSEKNKDFIFQKNKNKTVSPITLSYEETFAFSNVTDQTTVIISSNDHQKNKSVCSFFEKCSYSVSTGDYSNNNFLLDNKNLSQKKSKRKKSVFCPSSKKKFIENLKIDKKRRTLSLHGEENVEKCTENILNVIANKEKQNKESFKYLKNLCKSFKILKKPNTKKKNNRHLIPLNKKTQKKTNKIENTDKNSCNKKK